MKKTLFAALALVLSTGIAVAQDVRADRTGVYIGGTIGNALESSSKLSMGVVGGYQVHRNVRLEATYDTVNYTTGSNTQLLMGNAVAQYRIPGTDLTPYVLAGAGVGFGRISTNANSSGEAVYNVGGGLRYAITPALEVDARYRYVARFDSANAQSVNLVTIGANYRF